MKHSMYITLNQPRTHKCVRWLHKQQDFIWRFQYYVGVNTLYKVLAYVYISGVERDKTVQVFRCTHNSRRSEHTYTDQAL